jgi:hypothetical protein
MVSDLTASVNGDLDDSRTLKEWVKQTLDDGGAMFLFGRDGRSGRRPALLITMLHHAAVRDVGPILKPIIDSVKSSSTANYVISAEDFELQPPDQLFTIMGQKGLNYAWTTADVAGLETTLVAFMGSNLTRAANDALREHGWPYLKLKF